MARSDANSVAFRAVRSIVEAAAPFETDIGGTTVRVSAELSEAKPWPDDAPSGLDPASDGSWPRVARVHCEWDGGKADFEVELAHWPDSGRYRHMCGVRVGDTRTRRELVWITIANRLGEAADNDVVPIAASVAIRRGASESPNPGLSLALKGAVAESDLPMLTTSRVEAFRIEVATAAVQPSPAAAFRRLVRLALLKLDFVDPEGTSARGRALFDVAALSDKASPPGAGVENDEPDEADEPDSARRYWAGGFLWEESMLDEFLAGDYWQLGYKREDTTSAARTTWKRFERVETGDWFAIKGYGGTHDLVVHYLGEVTSVDLELGRLELRPIDGPRYQGKAPRGEEGGNWRDTLVPVTRPDVVELLFGVSPTIHDDAQAKRESLPANLILYGPPGTGKTFRLQRKYEGLFTRRAAPRQRQEALESFVVGLTWFQTTMLALRELGGEGSVPQLVAHPYLKTKYAAQAPKAPLGAFLWNCCRRSACA